ncbi:MAG: DMT family transporter [Gammaproteobacteria bacterium]
MIGATLWGIIWYPLRVLEASGLSGLWVTLLIYSAATIVGLYVLLVKRYAVENRPAMWLLALANGWCNVAFFLAIIDGNIVRVLLLFYLSPLWTVLLGCFLLKESVTKLAVLVISFAVLGALIMLWDSDSGDLWPKTKTDWLAISSGFAFALSNVFVRKVQDVPDIVKTFFVWLGVVILAGIFIFISGESLPETSYGVIITTFLLGGVLIVIMTITVVYGVTRMPVHRSAVILLFELVAGAVSAQILTQELVTTQEWLGGGLIVVAAIFAAKRQIRQNQQV